MPENTESMADRADTPAATLLQRLGGDAALNSLVGALYFNVLADERIAGFFADKDVARLLTHQRGFFAALLGEESPRHGRDLRGAHRELVEDFGLNDTHFRALVEVFSITLDRLGYGVELRDELVARVMGFRDEVLGPGS
jgi:hemoglobin